MGEYAGEVGEYAGEVGLLRKQKHVLEKREKSKHEGTLERTRSA